MKYKSKKFLIDGFNVSKIAKIYKTPVYCYSFKKLQENIKDFKKVFKQIILYVFVKANSNKILLKR